MVDSIRPISDLGSIRPERPKHNPYEGDMKLWVKLKSTDEALLNRIELILSMFPGAQQIIIYMEDTKRRIGSKCLIHPALIDELRERCGEENVVVTK